MTHFRTVIPYKVDKSKLIMHLLNGWHFSFDPSPDPFHDSGRTGSFKNGRGTAYTNPEN